MHGFPLRWWMLVSCALAQGGCKTDWDREALTQGTTSSADALLEVGRAGYGRYCAGCHGEQGDGNGPAARFLSPKPRDFRLGKVKFALVPAGDLARDEDLLHTITYGLAGTSMPSWNLVPEGQRRAIVAYIKTFSPAYQTKRPGAPVIVDKDPWRDAAAAIAEGERVYHGAAGCITCHAAYVSPDRIRAYQTDAGIAPGFRDDVYVPIPKESQWGGPIRPPDFLVDRIKTGWRKEDIVRTVSAGVGGTAMPTWAGGLASRQLWALAYYVESLALLRGTPEGSALKRQLTQPQG